MTRGNEPVGVHRVEAKKKRLNPWWIVRQVLSASCAAFTTYVTGLSFGTIARCWDYESSKYSWQYDKAQNDMYLWCSDNRGYYVLACAWVSMLTCLVLSVLITVADEAYHNGNEKYLEE